MRKRKRDYLGKQVGKDYTGILSCICANYLAKVLRQSRSQVAKGIGDGPFYYKLTVLFNF
jgi:hypothetical protein